MIPKSKLEHKENPEIRKQQEGAKRLETFCNTYYGIIEERIENFKEVKEYLSHALEELLAEDRIGLGVILLSRIKSPESVIQNLRLGKNIHDIFGITLLTENEQEMNEIRKKIREEQKFNVNSKKEMNQKRGYEAIHFLFNVDNKDNKKVNVECHMQTHDAYKNVYPHVFYKVRRSLDRDLTPEDEKIIEKKIQTMFERGKLAGRPTTGGRKTRLPQMWVATFNNDGKMEEMELEETQKLLIMYPFLDISKNKEEER